MNSFFIKGPSQISALPNEALYTIEVPAEILIQ